MGKVQEQSETTYRPPGQREKSVGEVCLQRGGEETAG